MHRTFLKLVALLCCVYVATGQFICERSIYGNGAYASQPANVTCNAGEVCGRIEGTTNANNMFIGTNCYSAAGCINPNCELIARTQLSSVIQTSEIILTCNTECCVTSNACNRLPLSGSTESMKPRGVLTVLLLICSAFFSRM